MNLYGFASGDPVNFSDPFGLCPPIEDCLQQLANWGAQKGGAVGSVALNGAAALNAVNDFNPVSAAFDAGFDIGSGHVGRGLAMAALAVAPVGGEGRVVIGKVAALEAEGAIGAGERTLLPKLAGDLGSPKANWARNAGVLRAEMGRGLPIRDASVNAVTGALENNTGFLRAERNLLQSKGWTYDASSRLWNPSQ